MRRRTPECQKIADATNLPSWTSKITGSGGGWVDAKGQGNELGQMLLSLTGGLDIAPMKNYDIGMRRVVWRWETP